MSVDPEAKHAQINWPIVFEPLSNACAFSLRIRSGAVETNVSRRKLERINQRAAKESFARRRTFHRKTRPFIELDHSNLAEVFRTRLREKFISAHRRGPCCQAEQRIRFVDDP